MLWFLIVCSSNRTHTFYKAGGTSESGPLKASWCLVLVMNTFSNKCSRVQLNSFLFWECQNTSLY